MTAEKGIFVPLFLRREEPFSAYIVDNKIIGCDHRRFGDMNTGNGKRAYNLLLQLFNSKEGMKIFPQELKVHFEGQKEIFEYPGYYYLASMWDQVNQDTFNLSIKVENSSVLLYNCEFRDVPINLQTHVTVEEAFIIFANLCVDNQAHLMTNYYSADKAFFNMEKIEYDLSERLKFYKENIPIKFERMPNPDRLGLFVFSYLVYLMNKFEEGEITPLEILRLGGANALAILAHLECVKNFTHDVINKLKSYQKLSKNEIILYYSFLDYLRTRSYRNKVAYHFFRDSKELISNIEKLISLPFLKNEKEILISNFSISSTDREKRREQLKKEFLTSNPSFFSKKSDLVPPFYCTRGLEFSTMIIKNQIIGCDISYGLHGQALRSFNILRKLDQQGIFNELIPKELTKLLLSNSMLMHGGIFTCVLGSEEFDLGNCLKFKTNFDSKNSDKILLDSFTINTIPINEQVSFSPKETFILFSNICCLFECYHLKRNLMYKKINPYDFHEFRLMMDEQTESLKNHFTQTHWKTAVQSFVINYLEYIYNLLQEETITPIELLKLSGAGVLDFFSDLDTIQSFTKKIIDKIKEMDKLVENELVFYYSYLESIQLNSKSGKIIKKFYLENKDLIGLVRSIVKKSYPTKVIESENKKSNYYETNVIYFNSSESKEMIRQTINLARNKEHKIVLIKNNSFIDTNARIAAAYSSSVYYSIMDSVWLKMVLEKMISDENITVDPEVFYEQAQFNPPLTKAKIISLLDEHLNGLSIFKKEGFFEIVDLFSYITNWMKSDIQSFTAIIEALIEISKKTLIVLPHPDNELCMELEMFLKAIPDEYIEEKSIEQQKLINSIIEKGIIIDFFRK